MQPYKLISFSEAEYKRRIDATKQAMKQRGIDLVMLNAIDDLTYLTGFQTTGYGTFGALFIPVDDEPFAVTRLLEEANFLQRTYISQTHSYVDHINPLVTVQEAVKKWAPKAKTLGIQQGCFFLTADRQAAIKDMWADKTIVDVTDIVRPIRATKSEVEIDFIAKAAHACEEGVKAGIEATQVGVTENDIAAAVHAAMFKAGGEYPSVSPYITSGPRTIIGHATWEGRKVENNESVFIEVAGCYRRYHAAMMRTVYLGSEPPKEIVELGKIVLDDIQMLMAKMRPGITAGEIDELARNPKKLEQIEKLGGTRISRTGYGMGIAYAPSWDEGHIVSLVRGSQVELQENMVFHLIPWVQIPKYQSVMSISETVKVTGSGAQSFFTIPGDLVIKS